MLKQLGIMGEKLGMTSIFIEQQQVPVTAVKISGNVVAGHRTEETDGYNALIIGFGEQRMSRLNRPQSAFMEKQGLVEERDGVKYTKRHLREFRVSAEELASYAPGTTLKGDEIFLEGESIDVTGTSKGRGFTGVMKRHNFAGTKATHGVHEYFRHGGSIGSNTYPARVFKNKKMPGQHGNKRVTMQNLSVVQHFVDEGVILIRGGIPGPNGGLVFLRKAMKRRPG